MTSAPLVVRETTNLEDAARFHWFLFPQLLLFFQLKNQKHKILLKKNKKLFDVRLLLETKYRRLPVVDDEGKLVSVFFFFWNIIYLDNIVFYKSYFKIIYFFCVCLKVGIITRGNVVRAALKIKKENEMKWKRDMIFQLYLW